LVDARGAAVGIVLEAVDITERRETEAALRQSQKLEAMGQLTGGVAHDFNNLLTPIIGGLDLLQRRDFGGGRERRLIDGALQSAERARTLVQRLLAFARRQPLRTEPVNVAALIAGMADLVCTSVGPRIEVVCDAPADLPHAQADANQLEMAILNLSVNARDAMPEGGRLTVSARPEIIGVDHRSHLQPGRYLRIAVADTGLGMDEATLVRAIEPFFSTKSQGRGTGLGLSMAHGLASQLGGALAIASRPGEGTIVELWLPVSVDAPTPRCDAKPERNDSRHAGTVLLVDDEALARASTAMMLSDLGYHVVEAASATEAIERLDSGCRVDLLVTDHLMPGVSGADLARAFRDRNPTKPALIVSGFAESMPTELPHLAKPFRQSDLAAAIASLAPQPR
jgi:nitrogen-specific signal transduction histidine kinase/CheY-like chemotaxis protein